MAPIQALPTETLLQIFRDLPAKSVVACSSTSKLFRRATDQSIWRHRCLQDFAQWDQRHNLPDLLTQPSSDVDWQKLYVERCGIHRNAQRALDTIVKNQVGRLERVRSVIDYGVDIEDVLRRNINALDSEPDVLARRWYARAILGRLQRGRAIQTWVKLAESPEADLIEALYAFDLFVRNEQCPSYVEITRILNVHAQRCKASVPDWEDLTTREKATTLSHYLVANDLVGLKDHHDYSNIRNSFIGHALTHPEHPSLQLISTAIYCGVGKVLGLDAKPCGFPGHVFTIVFAKEGLSIDDRPQRATDDGESQLGDHMYLDPYTSSAEKPAAELLSMLRQLGLTGLDVKRAMGPSSNTEIVLRCGRNIINAVQARPDRRSTPEEMNFNTALYGSLWSFLILTDIEGGLDPNAALARRQTFFPHFMDRFEHHFPFDAHLLVETICPLFNASEERQFLRNHLRDLMGKDSIPPEVKLRRDVPTGSVRYRIGQVFQHVRYGYQGIIHGWDIECEASEDWMERMDVARLKRGQRQSFYHIIADDGTVRYVAEDNIRIVESALPSPGLLAAAGQWFKRWDPISNEFVSNVVEEYPDD